MYLTTLWSYALWAGSSSAKKELRFLEKVEKPRPRPPTPFVDPEPEVKCIHTVRVLPYVCFATNH